MSTCQHLSLFRTLQSSFDSQRFPLAIWVPQSLKWPCNWLWRKLPAVGFVAELPTARARFCWGKSTGIRVLLQMFVALICFDAILKLRPKAFLSFFLKNSRNIGTDWIHGTIWFTCIHKAIWVVNAGKIKQVFRRSLISIIFTEFSKKMGGTWGGTTPSHPLKKEGFSMIFQASICGYPQVGGFYVPTAYLSQPEIAR